MWMNRFKSIANQNTSQSISIQFNPHNRTHPNVEVAEQQVVLDRSRMLFANKLHVGVNRRISRQYVYVFYFDLLS